MRVVESINHKLHELMSADENLIILGEDILDPYGGAFKVTKGLSSAYPDRVWTTPISEAGIIGMGIGLALKGKPVIAELMFGDFITLAADQLINHAGKFRWMYQWGDVVVTDRHIHKAWKNISAVCRALPLLLQMNTQIRVLSCKRHLHPAHPT
jgi:pyruvate/2-oxoglutarate/acetoin dehydrogenase E1 component